MKKINQRIVHELFLTRFGLAGTYYDEDDVQIIKDILFKRLNVSLSNVEVISFWKWRCNLWDGSWFGVDGERDQEDVIKFFEEYVATHLDAEHISELLDE